VRAGNRAVDLFFSSFFARSRTAGPTAARVVPSVEPPNNHLNFQLSKKKLNFQPLIHMIKSIVSPSLPFGQASGP